MVNKSSLLKTDFRSSFFGILSYFSAILIFYFLHKILYSIINISNQSFNSFLVFISALPSFIFSYLNLKSIKRRKYKKCIRSILLYSLTISVVFIFHVFFLGWRETSQLMLILFLCVFTVAFCLSHLSYLLIFVKKKPIEEDLIDN